jgi:hypothetical protein
MEGSHDSVGERGVVFDHVNCTKEEWVSMRCNMSSRVLECANKTEMERERTVPKATSVYQFQLLDQASQIRLDGRARNRGICEFCCILLSGWLERRWKPSHRTSSCRLWKGIKINECEIMTFCEIPTFLEDRVIRLSACPVSIFDSAKCTLRCSYQERTPLETYKS